MTLWQSLMSLSLLGWVAVLIPFPLLALAVSRTVRRRGKPLTLSEQKKQSVVVTIALAILVAALINCSIHH